jgi:threonyl-tRNA synthetase
VELDDRNETLAAKIRNAQLQKVPYMLIVGQKEAENSTVSVRLRSGEDLGPQSLAVFQKRIQEKVTRRLLDL